MQMTKNHQELAIPSDVTNLARILMASLGIFRQGVLVEKFKLVWN